MSRVSRIPYHQNVYDLLQLEPGVCPDAARMIAEHEAAHGPLPASVREWYLVPNAVPLRSPGWRPDVLWYRYGDGDWPVSLSEVLDQFAHVCPDSPSPYVHVINGHQMECRWWVRVEGAEDPPVFDDRGRGNHGEWQQVAVTFSEFLINWFLYDCFLPIGDAPFWLRTPAEPFEPAVIDFLAEQLEEPERTPRPANVTTYTFRPGGGIIRVTADEPTLGGGLSAWWIHAATADRLAEFARLVLPFGTLRETLRADTEPATQVLQLIRM